MNLKSLANESLIRNRSTRNNELIRSVREAGLSCEFSFDAKWAACSSMGAGSAHFYCVKTSPDDSCGTLVQLAHEAGFTLYPIGMGSNLIGSDQTPEDILFIKISSEPPVYNANDNTFHASAGLPFRSLLVTAAKSGFGGAAALSGIPGSVGGIIRMNAGANGAEVKQFVESVTLLDLQTGETSEVNANDLGWSYRSCALPANTMVLAARFRFIPCDPDTELAVLQAEQERRKEKNPQGRSAGSVFKNPSTTLSAGYLLEHAGMKGHRIGSFGVSERHANWIINSYTPASAEDCTALIREMQRAVYCKYSIYLKPEVKIINMNNIETNEVRPLNILLLKGGVSSERDISLLSAANVAAALREAGHHVTEYDITKLEITDEMRNADVVYPVLHGGFGEDGRIQQLLEDAGIACVGGNAESCRIAMDKAASKEVMDRAGIVNAAYVVLDHVIEEVPAHLHFPLIVKPNSEGSTFGLSFVRSADEWIKAQEFAFKFDKKVLVEEFIDGTEATCAIYLGQPLPLIEIRYPGKLYDFDAKYTHAQGETQYLCPPVSIAPEIQEKAAKIALKFAQALGNTDMIRIDVIIRDSDKEVFVLEGNSLPGFTESSLFPKAAKVAGYSCPEICSQLAMQAYRRKKA